VSKNNFNCQQSSADPYIELTLIVGVSIEGITVGSAIVTREQPFSGTVSYDYVFPSSTYNLFSDGVVTIRLGSYPFARYPQNIGTLTITTAPAPVGEPINVTLSRDAGGQLVATITVLNPTAQSIPDVTLVNVKASTLDGTQFVYGVPAPQPFGTLAPNQAAGTRVTFPGYVGGAGRIQRSSQGRLELHGRHLQRDQAGRHALAVKLTRANKGSLT